MARVNIKVDVDGVKAKAERMTKLGQVALASQVHADMNPYVPARSYDLRNQSTIAPDSKSIIYQVPYARRQFYNLYSNYTTPGTGPRWDLKAEAIHGAAWVGVVERAMK